MIVFYRLEGRDYKEIGRVEDGEIVDGEDTLDGIIYRPNLSDEDELLAAHDGPHVLAQMEDKSTEGGDDFGSPDRGTEKYLEKKWIPYEGPKGGEGWQNTHDSDDIRYVEDPPGEIADGWEEQAEGWGESQIDNVGWENASYDQFLYAIDSVFGNRYRESVEEQTSSVDEVKQLMDSEEEWRREAVENALSESEWTESVVEIDGIETNLAGMSKSLQEQLSEQIEEVTTEHDIPEESVQTVTTEPIGSTDSMANAVYHGEESTLYLNPHNLKDSELDAMEGDMVSNTPEEVLQHELVHAAHWGRDGYGIDEPIPTESEQKILAEQVSKYAAQTGMEAVAEIGVLLMNGEQVSDEVMDIYRRFGGPDL